MPLNSKLKKVMVIGSGPIVIGQAAEFDYAGTQACRALKEEGLEVVLVNSNPATIIAIRQAGRVIGQSLGWKRLTGCNMYVTMEPCSMCAGALVWARIEKLYIGSMDPKAGGCGSVFNIVQDERLNHQLEVIELEEGELKTQCQEIVRDFFRDLREKKKAEKADKKVEKTI